MAFQVSPGVVTQELDLSSIIPAVSTTIAGYAAHFEWGPVDKIVTVDSENNLVALFGEPKASNYEEWFPAANFLGYGSNLKVVRGVSPSGAVNSSGPSAGTNAVTYIPNSDKLPDSISGAGATHSWAARYPGTRGDSLRVRWHDGGYSGGVSASQYDNWALKNNFQTKLPVHSQFAEDATGRTSGIYDLINVAVVDEDGLFSGVRGTVLEVFDGVSKASNAKSQEGESIYYRDVINDSSAYIYTLAHPAAGNAHDAYSVTGDANSLNWGSEIVAGYTGDFKVFRGSSLGYDVSLSGGTGEFSGTIATSGTSQGYGLFSDPDTEDVNVLICGALTGGAAKAVIEIAEARKDAVAFCSPEKLDVLSTNGTPRDAATQESNVIDYRTDSSFNVNSSYGFLDSGWKYQYDRFSDKYRYVPLNGDVAGLAVRSDEATETWFSPAGFSRGQIRGVVKLAFNPSKTNRDNLYKEQINPVVSFPGEGTVLFGDKTLLSRPSAFDRLNVRRLFIVLEKAIATAAKYQLFEQNDEFTRAHFRSMVEPFLRDVRARRGLTDFKVICDSSNNTAAVVDRNEFVADIYIKPTKSINFINLTFVATSQGVDFSEIGS
jgi:hypothetical protein